MTIYKQETISYDYGSERNIYSFPPLKDCDDLTKFMVLLESMCGTINEIMAEKHTADGKTYIYYKKYDDLPDFFDNFDFHNMQEYNTYVFAGCNKEAKFKTHCELDTVKNILNVYKYHDGSDKSKNDDYAYYKFRNDIIVRMNMTGSGCYYLTNDNRWKLDYSYEDWVYDAAYDMVEISDPLNGKADEYERQYEENLAKRMEKYYKQFADKINIVEPDDSSLSSKT